MNLENIMNNISSINDKMENLPFLGKLGYQTEINTTKQIMNETKDLLGNYTPTEEWYLNIGDIINQTRNILYESIEKTYKYHNVVKKIESIPKIGHYVKRKETELLNWAGIKYLPKKENLLEVIDKSYDASLSALCNVAEVETGIPKENYWKKLHQKPILKPKKPGFLDYLSDAIDSIGDMFSNVFGYST